MADPPMYSPMPGADGACATHDFDRHEIAGMRSAGWILVATAVLAVVSWLITRVGIPPVPAIIDLFLGAKLLGLQHSWRFWTLLRAGFGLAIGAFLVITSPFGRAGIGGSITGLAQLAYCGCLFLLLYGVPTKTRVILGRLLFALSIALFVFGALVTVVMQRLR